MPASHHSNVILTFFTEFHSFLQSSSQPILITSHRQADPDALGAALVLYHLLKSLTDVEIAIVLPTVSKQTEKLISSFSLSDTVKRSLNTDTKAKQFCIILVDTNQPAITDLQLIFDSNDNLEIWRLCKTRVIIDHHLQSEKDAFEIDYQLLVTEYKAASELVYDLYKQSGIAEPDKTILSVGLLGILFDTKRLILANARVLKTVAHILSITGETIENYLPYLDSDKDYSERVANLKAGQRNKLVIIEEKYLLSLSFISSFEASAARSLQFLGSDIAAVLNRQKNEIRISFRSSKKFYEETGVHCGELTQELAKMYSGTGSGHPTSAGCNITTNSTNNEIFESIIEKISKQVKLRLL